MERLVSVEISPRVHQKQGAIALCLELHDLVLAKCAAGRDRDWDYAEEALAAGLVDLDQLMARVADLPIDVIAQKLHACTEVFEGEENARVHDLMDLLLAAERLSHRLRNRGIGSAAP